MIDNDEIKKNNSNKIKYLGLGLAGISYFLYTKRKKNKELPVVDYVDLEKYSGKWYEFAAIQDRHEKGCSNITAEYFSTNEGYIKVVNTCVKDIIEETKESIEGKAYPVKGANNAKLKVQFFWPFKGDYWIIDLDKEYRYAMVGNPKRKNLWILSRTTKLDESIYNRLLKKAESLGFNIKNIKKTEHFKPRKDAYIRV